MSPTGVIGGVAGSVMYLYTILSYETLGFFSAEELGTEVGLKVLLPE